MTSHRKKKKGILVLSDGSIWRGDAFGAAATKIGETVFHTGHTGYQEVLTDPSYRKQILTFTVCQLGNQGFHDDDFESSQIWASGCVARDFIDAPFHWRKQRSLDAVFKEFKIPGLCGVDTRRLVLHLRQKGSLWGVISTESENVSDFRAELAELPTMEGLTLTQEVSTKVVYSWTQSTHALIAKARNPTKSQGLKRCVVMDFGVKRQSLRYLIDAGFQEVLVVPSQASVQQIHELKPDALFLSNGPGDPAAETELIQNVKQLLRRYPILGICLGHQILALALGLKTYKLKFGHHGANHPVKNLTTNRVEITSQNHGFAVILDSLPREIELTHLNLNDQTIEGFRHQSLPLRGLQFHPEAGPGPLDTREIFSDFQRGFST